PWLRSSTEQHPVTAVNKARCRTTISFTLLLPPSPTTISFKLPLPLQFIFFHLLHAVACACNWPRRLLPPPHLAALSLLPPPPSPAAMAIIDYLDGLLGVKTVAKQAVDSMDDSGGLGASSTVGPVVDGWCVGGLRHRR
ncbi:hypothetical protein Dimus_036396, partial [Dionaea muscipula]